MTSVARVRGILFQTPPDNAQQEGTDTMFYRKNLPIWERIARVVAGALMITCGLIGLKGMPIGYLIASVGLFTGLTGFVGFCPVCALAGRKLR